jgi:hypothetical protein
VGESCWEATLEIVANFIVGGDHFLEVWKSASSVEFVAWFAWFVDKRLQNLSATVSKSTKIKSFSFL